MSRGSPSSRWTSQHGYGQGRQRARLRKIAYATKAAAQDRALIMDLRYGEEMSVYECRWGDDYRDGETAPLHWHIGRKWARQALASSVCAGQGRMCQPEGEAGASC